MVFQQRALKKKTNKKQTKTNQNLLCFHFGFHSKITRDNDTITWNTAKTNHSKCHGSWLKDPFPLDPSKKSNTHIFTSSIYTYLPGKMIQDLGTEQEYTEPE